MKLPVRAVLATIPMLLSADWHQWRGPNFNGVANSDAPLTWSDDKNIAWKTPIPGRAFSTPVIAGNLIFVTTAIPTAEAAEQPAAPPPSGPPAGGGRGPGGPPRASGANQEHRFVVMAINRTTGKLVWERTANTAVSHEGYHGKYGSFASYAPVTDGKHVWAMFGSYGLFCYDMAGKLIWKMDLPPVKTHMAFGEGGSPALAGNKLILKVDRQNGSFITVLEKTTGKEIWRKDREELSSWSTPLVAKVGNRELIITSASTKTRAYDLETGEVVWECAGLGMNVIPAPVVHGDKVIVMSGYRDPNQMAIKLDSKGDVSKSEAIVWSNQRGNSYTPAPVLHDGKLYFITDSAQLSCVDAATGKEYYRQQRLPKPYNIKSSPVAAGGKLYIATEEGDVVVVKLGETFEVLATNTLTDQFFEASPVVVDKTIYLRSANMLFAVKE